MALVSWEFLNRDLSVFHRHWYKCMIFEIVDKIQLSDCKVNQASWSAGQLEGSMNMNLTCKMSKKFHIPKQTPSTGGSSRQSHSRCSVHIYIYIYTYILYKYIQPIYKSIYVLSSSLHFSLSKLFVSRSDLALRTWYTFFGLLVSFACICHPNPSPAVCFGRYWCHDQWRWIF